MKGTKMKLFDFRNHAKINSGILLILFLLMEVQFYRILEIELEILEKSKLEISAALTKHTNSLHYGKELDWEQDYRNMSKRKKKERIYDRPKYHQSHW